MAQKANIQTLRNECRSHFIVHNTKFWGSLFFLINDIIRLFTIKGGLPFNFHVFFENSTLIVNSSVFYQAFKISFYKQKFLYKFKSINTFSANKSKSFLLTIFKKYIKMYKFTSLVLSITNLNKYIEKKDLFFFYKKLKLYIKSIFDRRFKFFIDFIKMTSLFMHGKISPEGYLKILARVFKNISKRLHSQFYRFIKVVFTQIFNFAKVSTSLLFKPAGIKLLLCGRLKGKERGSCHLLSIGKVPIQSFSKTIYYAAEHIHTVYGVYGIKAWFFFDNQQKIL